MDKSYSISNAVSDLKTLENIERILNVAKDNVFSDEILSLIGNFEETISYVIDSQKSNLAKTIKTTPPEEILEMIL